MRTAGGTPKRLLKRVKKEYAKICSTPSSAIACGGHCTGPKEPHNAGSALA